MSGTDCAVPALDRDLPYRVSRFMQGHRGILCKCLVQHGAVIVPIVWIIESHRNQRAPIALGSRHQTPPALFSISGFDPDCTLVQTEHLIVIDHRAPGAGDVFGTDDLAEIRILQRVGGQLGQFACGRMVGITI